MEPILIACEYSGAVSGAFRERGHEAWSCDILPTEGDPRWHIQGDVRAVMRLWRWRLIVMHVPCTAMAVCGNKHYGEGAPRNAERLDAVAWTLATWEQGKANADAVVLENPASVIFPFLRARGADVQYIHPWEHGHPEQKKTGLALHNIGRLRETNNVYEAMMQRTKRERERIFHMPPSADRGKERARFFPGWAAAMADQWGAELGAGNREAA